MCRGARLKSRSCSRAAAARRESATHRQEEAILKDIVEVADRYSTAIRTTMRANVAPEAAILREAQTGRYDLIIMGVSRRSGEKLFFGNTARTVLERAKCSVMLLSDGLSVQKSVTKGDQRAR